MPHKTNTRIDQQHYLMNDLFTFYNLAVKQLKNEKIIEIKLAMLERIQWHPSLNSPGTVFEI